MKEIKFSFSDVLVPQGINDKNTATLREEIATMRLASKNYNANRAFLRLPFDKENTKKCKALAKEKSALRPSYLVVIGVGGSSLGTIAVQRALPGKSLKILYAEAADPATLKEIKRIIEKELKRGRKIILNCVTKSGRTAETMANFAVLLASLKKYCKSYKKCVVVTTDEGSPLHEEAMKEGYSFLPVPPKVGGRYSVFSPVSLFPLEMLGIDGGKLLEGAVSMATRCMGGSGNPAVESASALYYHMNSGRNIHDSFFFSSALEALGKWYRQLMAESLGKNGKGMTPTISLPCDLHSMAQLYLGGPPDKFTSFVTVERGEDAVIPSGSLKGKTLVQLNNAIYSGTKAAFRQAGRPFAEIVLPDASEESIGQFMQFKMMETVFLGRLMGVNPFDQPNVESYKEETRRILGGQP